MIKDLDAKILPYRAAVARLYTYSLLSRHCIATATRQQVENRSSGFRKLLAWEYQQGGPTGLLCCLEHTATADPEDL